NLAQRSLSMISRNCGGRVPRPRKLSDVDEALIAKADALLETCRSAFARQQVHQALAAIWQVVAEANRYFASEEPWAKRKTDPERMETILWVTAETVRQIAILA